MKTLIDAYLCFVELVDFKYSASGVAGGFRAWSRVGGSSICIFSRIQSIAAASRYSQGCRSKNDDIEEVMLM